MKTSLLILANLIAVLAYVGHSVRQSEEILDHGQLVLLELAPVDPRSLMQGDYMRLRYAVANPTGEDMNVNDVAVRGHIILRLDENGVGRRVRFQPDLTPLSPGELALPYHKNRWQLSIGAESFFFQEGRAGEFQRAKYGGLRVDGAGNAILVGLFDEERIEI